MKNKTRKKLALNRETLTAMQLDHVAGGYVSGSGCITKPQWSCGPCSRIDTNCGCE